MIGYLLLGIVIGFIIFLVGVFVYGCSMAENGGSYYLPTSRRKKFLGFLATVVVFVLGVWILYKGIISLSLPMKMICGIGGFLIILSFFMLYMSVDIVRNNYNESQPSDYWPD